MTLSPTNERKPHTHRDCGSRERVWLAKDCGSPATAAKHPYCLDCGTVRNLARPRGKPLGYFLSGIATLKEYLEHDPLRTRLMRVQSHLITNRLVARPEFEDPYGVSGQAQIDAYLGVIRSVRSDLDAELILHLLPNPGARRRRETPVREESPPIA